MKKTGAVFASVALVAMLLVSAAQAGEYRLGYKYQKYKRLAKNYYISQNYGDGYSNDGGGYGNGVRLRISPSDAALIAKRTWPGAKVLRVQLLPSGLYAVTLKQGGQVSRVLVDARSGDIV
jgi:uncharacterized membrane protein YkoI